MAQKFDYALGLTETIIPSKQDEREREHVGAFRVLVERKITPKVKSNFAFIGLRELNGPTDAGMVQDHLIEQAITMYQVSAKAAQQ